MPRVTKKSRVREYAAARGWTSIGEAEWKELHTSLPDIADSTLRSAGLTIAQPWRGVVQHSLDELEISLEELALVYESRPDFRRYCRELVIAAKDRARWASRSVRVDERRREMKAEMVAWMLVWLDDPSMFTTWVRLRRLGVGGKTAGASRMSEGIRCDVCGGTGQCTRCKGTSNGGQCFNCAGTGNCPQCQGTGRREVEHAK